MDERSEAWKRIAKEPRPCVRCFAIKDATEFPLGGGRRRSYQKRWVGVTRVCFACIESEARSLNDGGYRPRIVCEDEGLRHCARCNTPRPLERFKGKRGTCKDCRAERERAQRESRQGAELREHQAAYARRRRAESADVREKESAARKRYRQKVRADPQRYAKELEDHRIAFRLKREREGNPVTKYQPARGFNLGKRYLPSAPLAAFIDAKIEHQQSMDRKLGFDDRDVTTVSSICHDLGIALRSLHAWRKGEVKEMQIGVAERVLLNGGGDAEEVWPRSQFPELYEPGGVLADA